MTGRASGWWLELSRSPWRSRQLLTFDPFPLSTAVSQPKKKTAPSYLLQSKHVRYAPPPRVTPCPGEPQLPELVESGRDGPGTLLPFAQFLKPVKTQGPLSLFPLPPPSALAWTMMGSGTHAGPKAMRPPSWWPHTSRLIPTLSPGRPAARIT